MPFIIHADESVRADSPVLVLLPGSGDAIEHLTKCFGRAPVPAWYIACDIGGRGDIGKRARAHNRKMPTVVPHLLELLKTWVGNEQKASVGSGQAASACRKRFCRKIFLVGYSRGASWGLILLQDHADLLNGAVLLAPYPETKEQWANEQRAYQIMNVPVPIMMIHFVDDDFCNAAKYPTWFATLAQGMDAFARGTWGFRIQSFYSTHLPGTHHRGKDIMGLLSFDNLEDFHIQGWWLALMSAQLLG